MSVIRALALQGVCYPITPRGIALQGVSLMRPNLRPFIRAQAQCVGFAISSTAAVVQRAERLYVPSGAATGLVLRNTLMSVSEIESVCVEPDNL